MKTIFFGTPDFSLPALELLHNHPLIDLVGVVSMPDRKSGRGQQLHSPPVAQFAKDNKIKLFQTENINKEESFFEYYQDKEVDLIVILAFAQFLGSKVLALPKQGCFNIHTSLLPSYRGAAPIQYALLNGDKESGVSIQKVVKKMDAGDLYLSHPMPIYDYENGGLLYTRLKFQAAVSLATFVDDFVSGKAQATPQDESKVTFAPTIKKEDGHLNFKEQNAAEIINRVRAFHPWPSAFCFLGEKRLKVLRAEVISKGTTLSAGIISTERNQLHIGTTDKTVRLCEVQLEGKKVCSDQELLNGLSNKADDEIVIS